jgi:hypothetical protein
VVVVVTLVCSRSILGSSLLIHLKRAASEGERKKERLHPDKRSTDPQKP